MSESMSAEDFNRQFEEEQKRIEASLVEFTIEYIGKNEDPKDPNVKVQKAVEVGRNANEASSIYNQMGFTVLRCQPTASMAAPPSAAPKAPAVKTSHQASRRIQAGETTPTAPFANVEQAPTYNYVKTPDGAPRCRIIIETGEVEFEIVKTIKFTESASVSKKITSLLKEAEARHIKVKYSNRSSSKTKLLSSFLSEFMDGGNTEALAVEELLVGGIWEKATPEDS